MGGSLARGFCRVAVAVVEASAAAVRIQNDSWGVASGQGPDMLQGTHDGLLRFLLRPPGAATGGRTPWCTESHELCGYAGRGVHSLFPFEVTCSRGLARCLAASDDRPFKQDLGSGEFVFGSA